MFMRNKETSNFVILNVQKTESKNNLKATKNIYKNLIEICIGESRIRDVWRWQNWNEMQMLCRSCDLNALLIRLGWQPWRPLGGTWRKCGTSACPTENRVGARPEPASASQLKYAVSWRQARDKSSQTKPSQAKSRQVEATRSQAEASRVSKSESLLTTNAAAHKESNAKKKERAKGKPETHNSTHSHTHTDIAWHTHSNKCHAYCATDPISRLVFFYTERTARRSSSGIGCGCGCGSHNGFEMLTGSAQPAATAAVWEIQRYFGRTDPAACSFTAAPDTVRQRATNTHTDGDEAAVRDRVRAWAAASARVSRFESEVCSLVCIARISRIRISMLLFVVSSSSLSAALHVFVTRFCILRLVSVALKFMQHHGSATPSTSLCLTSPTLSLSLSLSLPLHVLF